MSEEMIFCKNVKILRLKNNLTQMEMAHICGIGVKSLSSIEKGIIPPRLSVSILVSISNYFRISPYDMFDKVIK
ncbi:MAG: helix-turn-helix transcriptional regulator [Clostridia bacterium]|nr:helix-turn-helix transcriptional regulator [Clostridia bacterium]